MSLAYVCGNCECAPCECVFKADTDFSLNGERWIIKNFADYMLDNREQVLLKPSREKSIQLATNYVPDDILNKYAYYHPYIMRNRGISKNVED